MALESHNATIASNATIARESPISWTRFALLWESPIYNRFEWRICMNWCITQGTLSDSLPSEW